MVDIGEKGEKKTIREYAPGDCPKVARLFCDTVHTVNARDYNSRQLDA